jgi:DNA primase
MAGMVSKDVIDQIRNALDISDVIGSYIQVKRAGNSSKALCPFHKEKTPSFTINPARQAFHCFGCGAGGDVFKFIMLYENVDFPTSLKLMASRAGIAVQFDESHSGKKEGPGKDELFKVNEAASKSFLQELLKGPEAADARAYLKGRSLDIDACKEWGIGFAPDGWGFLSDKAGAKQGPKMKALEVAGLLSTNEKGNQYDRFRGRVMFTIRDELGRAVGFSGRILKPDEKSGGKYVNTPETPVFRKSRLLFGLDKAKREVLDSKTALLCEGQIDCIRCHLAGFKNAVASQGTAFTEQHARLLKRYADHTIIVLDADAAGRKAALRSAEILIAEGLTVSLASLPVGEDPDTLLLSKGPEAFQKLLDAAATPMGFLIGMFKERGNIDTQEGLMRATRAVVDLATHAQGAVQTEQMLREASAALGVSLDALQSDLRRAVQKKTRPYSNRQEETRPSGPSLERPVDEVELAALLGTSTDPEVAGLVRRWLPYPLISDPDCREIIHVFAEEEESDLMSALDDKSESCKALAARIVNSPEKLVSTEEDMNETKAAQDMILSIWRRYIEHRSQKLSQQMKTLQGAARQPVRDEFAQILLDQGKMKLGWEKACPIMDCHLHRMAEE